MGNRPANDMQAIADAIADEIAQATRRDNTVSISAQELAREFGVHAQTVTRIMRDMGLEYDGYVWYVARARDGE